MGGAVGAEDGSLRSVFRSGAEQSARCRICVRCAAQLQRPADSAAAGISSRQETAGAAAGAAAQALGAGRQAGWHAGTCALRLRAWAGGLGGPSLPVVLVRTNALPAAQRRTGLRNREKERDGLDGVVVTWSVSVRRGVMAKGPATSSELRQWQMQQILLMLPCGFLATPCSCSPTISYSWRAS